LSERLGIDPLSIWTGLPGQGATLVIKSTDFIANPPTFKYRGLLSRRRRPFCRVH
jgi:hypothetical protein